MTRLRAFELVLVAVLCGCTAEREPVATKTKEQPPAPAPAQPAVAEPEPAKAPAELPAKAPSFDPSLGERFTAAVAGIEVEPTTPRERTPSWKAPACTIEHELRVEIGNVGSGTPTRISGSWTTEAAASGMLVRNGELSTGQGTRRSESIRAGSLADVHLQTDGVSWTELDGPTVLWSAYGSWAGLSSFHPTLPASGMPESSVDWIFAIYDRSASGRAEAERGSLEVPEGVALPEPKPRERRAEITVERWIEIDGAAAIVLRSWSETNTLDDEAAAERIHGISQARYVVLESGALLHAELRQRTKYRLGAGEQATEYEVAVDGEARLVRSCEKPVLPRFDE